jgi:integrase
MMDRGMSKLTALQVKNAKPGRHADGKGLYLFVKPTGAKSWVLRIVVNGRRRDFGLGPVDLVSLTEAREKALEGRKMARNGFDPSLEWKKAAEVIPTFKAAAERYHGNVKGGWKNGKHQDQWLSTLTAHAFPEIGSTTVDQIDAAAIQRVLLPIWLVVPETARRVRQRIGAVLDYCHAQGWRAGEAPMRAVSKGLPKQPKKGQHFAAMPYSDVPAFIAKLREGESTVGRRALEFLVLTAARSGEVRGATWDEFDLENAVWNIPASRMKAAEAHSIPLSPAALAVLEEIKGLVTGRKGEPVFPGLKGKPLSDATLSKVLRVGGGEGYTVHGFRSSFRDWVAEKLPTVPSAVAEAALAHAVPNKVEAAYRRTKFLDQRRDLMSKWADYLSGRANVVRLAVGA